MKDGTRSSSICLISRVVLTEQIISKRWGFKSTPTVVFEGSHRRIVDHWNFDVGQQHLRPLPIPKTFVAPHKRSIYAPTIALDRFCSNWSQPICCETTNSLYVLFFVPYAIDDARCSRAGGDSWNLNTTVEFPIVEDHFETKTSTNCVPARAHTLLQSFVRDLARTNSNQALVSRVRSLKLLFGLLMFSALVGGGMEWVRCSQLNTNFKTEPMQLRSNCSVRLRENQCKVCFSVESCPKAKNINS